MTESLYYVLLNGEEKGPFSLEQLAEMLAKREVTLETLYAQPGMAEWLPLSKHRCLLERYAPGLLPTPSVESVMQVDDKTGIATLEITGLAHEAIWAQAISDAFHEKGMDVTVEVAGHKIVPNPRTERSAGQKPQLSEADIALDQAGIKINNGWLTIEEPHFYGQCYRSPNGRFILAWRSTTFAGAGDWIAESGKYLLLDGPTVILRGTLQSPGDGKVADNGNFILNDGLHRNDQADSPQLAGIFYAFSPAGENLTERRFEANLDANGISHDGRFAVCQTLGSFDDEDDSKLFLFDLEERKMLAHFALLFGSGSGVGSGKWVERTYCIDSATKHIRVAYENGLVHLYGFDGEFLDAEAWESQKLNYASGYELLRVAEERLPKLHGTALAIFTDVIGLFERALSDRISDFTQAKIHRYLGEIYDRCNDKSKAIEHLETALRLNPKIGVKKLIARLERGQF